MRSLARHREFRVLGHCAFEDRVALCVLKQSELHSLCAPGKTLLVGMDTFHGKFHGIPLGDFRKATTSASTFLIPVPESIVHHSQVVDKQLSVTR